MALLSKKEFAHKCGFPTNQLSVYIGRQKKDGKGGVVVNDQDLIDDQDEFNKTFMARRLAKNKMRPDDPAEAEQDPKPEEQPAKTIKKSLGSLEISKDTTLSEALRIEKVEKTLKMRRDREHKEIQIAKLNGELIPTELMKTLIVEHSTSIRNSFLQGIENLIVVISQQKELSAEETSSIKAKLSPLLNRAIDNSIANTKRRITLIVKEYSLKKSVGEHG